MGEIGVRRMKLVVGLEFEEVFERGFVCEYLSGDSRLGVFRGECFILIVFLVDCGKVSGFGDFCIFFKFFN